MKGLIISKRRHLRNNTTKKALLSGACVPAFPTKSPETAYFPAFGKSAHGKRRQILARFSRLFYGVYIPAFWEAKNAGMYILIFFKVARHFIFSLFSNKCISAFRVRADMFFISFFL